MKAADQYLKYVEWSDEDRAYVGYCPDLFPFGGVCHADSEIDAYQALCEIVAEHVSELENEHQPMPPRLTKPTRELQFA